MQETQRNLHVLWARQVTERDLYVSAEKPLGVGRGINTFCWHAKAAHRDLYGLPESHRSTQGCIFSAGELEEAQRNLHSLWKRQGSTTKVNTYTPPQLGLGTHRFKTDCEMGEGGA